MKSFVGLAIAIFILSGFVFVETFIMSKKMAALYNEMVNIEFYLKDGTCE